MNHVMWVLNNHVLFFPHGSQVYGLLVAVRFTENSKMLLTKSPLLTAAKGFPQYPCRSTAFRASAVTTSVITIHIFVFISMYVCTYVLCFSIDSWELV